MKGWLKVLIIWVMGGIADRILFQNWPQFLELILIFATIGVAYWISFGIGDKD